MKVDSVVRIYTKRGGIKLPEIIQIGLEQLPRHYSRLALRRIHLKQFGSQLVISSCLHAFCCIVNAPGSLDFPNNLANAFGPLPHVMPSQKQFDAGVLVR